MSEGRTLIPVRTSATVGDGDVITPRVRVLHQTNRQKTSKTGQARPPKTGVTMTCVALSISADDLALIDAAALRAGLNRSAYLATCGLACAERPRADIEVGAWAQRGKKR